MVSARSPRRSTDGSPPWVCSTPTRRSARSSCRTLRSVPHRESSRRRPWTEGANGIRAVLSDAAYLDATGYERVLLLMALPGLSTELALGAMRLFADEVAPKL